ncbi:MAG: hypothetical protein SGPRY_013119 [Prymnesium sp.]
MQASVAEEMNILNEELSAGLEERQGEGSQDAASHVVHLENFDEGDLDEQPAARPAVNNINAGSESGSSGRCGVPS